MAKFNAIVENKLKIILQKIEDLNKNNYINEADVINTVIYEVNELIKNGGLPDLKIKNISNSPNDYVTSEYFDNFQKQTYNAITTYNDVISDLSTRLNSLVDKLSEKLNENSKNLNIQTQELESLIELILNNNSKKSILDEVLVRHETLLDGNIKTKNVNISEKGSITLPIISSNLINRDDIKSISYNVLSPFNAEQKLSFVNNVSGKNNTTIINNGHFEGKLFGEINKPNDIRLTSDIYSLLDNQDDTFWELEYNSYNKLSSSFIVNLNIEFNNNILFNNILINSNNEIELKSINIDGDLKNIYDFNNESFTFINANNLKVGITQNESEISTYNLDAIRINNILIHRYNILETYHNNLYDSFKERFPNIKINEIKEIEENGNESDIIQETLTDINRYSIKLNDIKISTNEYALSGKYETNDIELNDKIYSIELQTNQHVYTNDFDYIKYSISFDSGQSWDRIKPLNEKTNEFNLNLPKRITLIQEGNKIDTIYKEIDTNKVRLLIEMNTNDKNISPVVFDYKFRIKLKGNLNA